MSTPKIITLDADGVLLDYSSAYAKAWERYSGLAPMEHQPYAYWPMERWGVPRLEGQDLVAFRRQFDEAFWGALPAIPGALQACQLLVQHGYELVCVTALDERFGQARRAQPTVPRISNQAGDHDQHGRTAGKPESTRDAGIATGGLCGRLRAIFRWSRPWDSQSLGHARSLRQPEHP